METSSVVADDNILAALKATLSLLKAAKPEDRSERARRYAVTITEYEKVISYFNTMVVGGFAG